MRTAALGDPLARQLGWLWVVLRCQPISLDRFSCHTGKESDQPGVTKLSVCREGSWLLSLAILVSGINANVAAAQTATQQQALKRCGVGLVLPGWLPPGFKMAAFKLSDCSESRFPGYEVTYKGPSQCEIELGGQNGGFGAPGWVREWKVPTKLFGTVVLAEMEGGSGSNRLMSMIIEPPYFKSYPRSGYIYTFSCQNKLFNVTDAKKILEASALAP